MNGIGKLSDNTLCQIKPTPLAINWLLRLRLLVLINKR